LPTFKLARQLTRFVPYGSYMFTEFSVEAIYNFRYKTENFFLN